MSESERLARIADAHRKFVTVGGLTDGNCEECSEVPWPCPTYAWATEDRDSMAPWDPADDSSEDFTRDS